MSDDYMKGNKETEHKLQAEIRARFYSRQLLKQGYVTPAPAAAEQGTQARAGTEAELQPGINRAV